MVVDAELLRDEPRDARRRPQVRAVAASPGEKRTRNAFSPPRRRAWYQRITDLAPQPMRRVETQHSRQLLGNINHANGSRDGAGTQNFSCQIERLTKSKRQGERNIHASLEQL